MCANQPLGHNPGSHNRLQGAHLAHGAVGLQEVRLQERIKQVPRHALDRIVNRQHVDALAVLHIRALRITGKPQTMSCLHG